MDHRASPIAPLAAAPTSPWWQRARHEDRRPRLLARNAIKAALRDWFLDQGFVEVETPALQVSPGNEAHLHAFRTDLIGPDGRSSPYYLHTSPEFTCKKLLAAGEAKIFTFATTFRNRERTALHHPEFTMLEWYRAGETFDALHGDCAALLRVAAAAAGTPHFARKGRQVRAEAAPIRLSLAEAFAVVLGADLGGCSREGAFSRAALADIATTAGVGFASDDTVSDIFSRLMAERIEPFLAAQEAPVFLELYPISEAALARPSPADPRFAERAELYLLGVELSNGFSELVDAKEQERRFIAEMNLKQARYGERYPIDRDFLAALDAMPPAAGMALGFDRLVMLATGAERITDVLWAPVAEPESPA